jgi:hypothetical protein
MPLALLKAVRNVLMCHFAHLRMVNEADTSSVFKIKEE